MGLLSKLFGKEAGEQLEGIAKQVGDALGGEKGGLEALAEALGDKAEAQERNQGTVIRSADKPQKTAPAGTYWGPLMPAEENQYNFNGTYVEYFDKVFREEFPEYEIEYHKERNWRSETFTFRKDGATALVVELLPKSSNAKLIRERCRRERIPYLRYYYNVEGWWNVRAYVVERTRAAL